MSKKLHSSQDPNSIKNIVGRLGAKFPGKYFDDLEDIAGDISNGIIKEEDVTLEMINTNWK